MNATAISNAVKATTVGAYAWPDVVLILGTLLILAWLAKK
jgi:hypothetical protein